MGPPYEDVAKPGRDPYFSDATQDSLRAQKMSPTPFGTGLWVRSRGDGGICPSWQPVRH
jgi:hypothetical protein